MTRVLLVDDHHAFRHRARALLEAEGFDVVGEAGDGRSAIAATRELAPDLLIVDIGLPDIDGFDLVNALAADGAAPPTILISSRDAVAYGPRLATSTALGFIAKDDLSGPAIARLMATR